MKSPRHWTVRPSSWATPITTPTLVQPMRAAPLSTPARALLALRSVTATATKPIILTLPTSPAMRSPTPCALIPSPCRMTALSAASLSPKQTWMPPGIWPQAVMATQRSKVPCTTCTPPRTFITRTVFPASSITPKSQMPAAHPFGTPPCLPTALGSPIISRC